LLRQYGGAPLYRANPDDFDYIFNLTYFKKTIEIEELTLMIRSLIDFDTKRLVNGKRPVMHTL
jgi:hypothetical protein